MIEESLPCARLCAVARVEREVDGLGNRCFLDATAVELDELAPNGVGAPRPWLARATTARPAPCRSIYDWSISVIVTRLTTGRGGGHLVHCFGEPAHERAGSLR